MNGRTSFSATAVAVMVLPLLCIQLSEVALGQKLGFSSEQYRERVSELLESSPASVLKLDADSVEEKAAWCRVMWSYYADGTIDDDTLVKPTQVVHQLFSTDPSMPEILLLRLRYSQIEMYRRFSPYTELAHLYLVAFREEPENVVVKELREFEHRAYMAMVVRWREITNVNAGADRGERKAGLGFSRSFFIFGRNTKAPEIDDVRMWAGLASKYAAESEHQHLWQNYMTLICSALPEDAQPMPYTQACERIDSLTFASLAEYAAKAEQEHEIAERINRAYQLGFERGKRQESLVPTDTSVQNAKREMERGTCRLRNAWQSHTDLCDFYAEHSMYAQNYPPTEFATPLTANDFCCLAYYQLRVRANAPNQEKYASQAAIGYLQRALHTGADSARLYSLMAWAFVLKGDMREAAESLYQAAQLDCEDSEYLRATALFTSSASEDDKDYLRELLAAPPKSAQERARGKEADQALPTGETTDVTDIQSQQVEEQEAVQGEGRYRQVIVPTAVGLGVIAAILLVLGIRRWKREY